MIILPVEKRLKWNKAPYVLFSIVFINVAIFFFYQMNDTEKYTKAAELYYQQNLDKVEVPIYLEYVELPENSEQKKTLDDLYDQTFQEELTYEEQESLETLGFESNQDIEQQIRKYRYRQIVVPVILQDSEFYDYLQAKPELFDSTKEYDSWQENRKPVNKLIEDSSSMKYALVPAEQNWFTFISHQFMHGGLMHLAGNMFFLIVCGFAVEAALGHLRFLIFYLICGALGGLAHVMSDTNSIIPLVGASGAISGVMAMYMGIFRLQKIEFFFWVYVIVGYFRAPALFILILYIAKEIYFYYFGPEGVAYMAHLGGFIAGIILIIGVLIFKRDFLDNEYIETDDSIEPEQLEQAQIKSALEKMHFKKALDLVSSAVKTGSSDNKYHRDNVLLTAKLLQLVNDEHKDSSVVKLLADNKPQVEELDDYLAIWTKIKNKDQTPPEARLKLGISFIELEDISVSENIFITLAKQKFKDTKMSVLAGRLAYHYDRLQQTDKAEYYLKLADAFK